MGGRSVGGGRSMGWGVGQWDGEVGQWDGG